MLSNRLASSPPSACDTNNDLYIATSSTSSLQPEAVGISSGSIKSSTTAGTTSINGATKTSEIATKVATPSSTCTSLQFTDVYETVKKLRSGSYGTVFECRRIVPLLVPSRDGTSSEDTGTGTSSDEMDEDNDDDQQIMKMSYCYEDQETEERGGGTAILTDPNNNDNTKNTKTYGTYAVKILDRCKIKRRDEGLISREVTILKELVDVPHVIHLVDFFETPETLFVVLALARGGDVFDRLSKRVNYTEKDARDVARILLETMDALHSRSPTPIVHRDVKPENLLLARPDDDTSILLADFGFARHVEKGGGCTTLCGTPCFVAPEIVLGIPYSTSVDLWSTGCLLYMLLGGYPPFTGQNHRALFRKIRAGDYIFHTEHFENVSIPAKRLISRLLTPSVDKRWTAREALQCDWFSKTDAVLTRHDLSASIPEIQKFQARRKWLSASDAIRWAASAPFWISDRATFHQQLLRWDQQEQQSPQQQENEQQQLQHQVLSAPVVGTVFTNSMLAKLPKLRFTDVYTLKSKLRTGSQATVWECVHKATGESFAAKVIQRQNLTPRDDEAVLNEVAIMQSLSDNKYVVQILDFYEEEDRFYIVMEYMSGGDVFDRLVHVTQYTEEDARDLVKILLKAVAGLHKYGIVHRDLKPQNLLLKKRDDPTSIKLADFGFARRVHTPQSLTERVGTPTFVAPEVLKNIPHDERVDLWAIGVIAYVLLVGYPPFMEDNQQKLFEKIRCGEWQFFEEDWMNISSDAKDFIRGLLNTDPADRWSIDQALTSRWINELPSQLSFRDLSTSLAALKKKKNRLRFLARAFLWTGGMELRPLEVLTQAQDTASAVIQKVSRG